jgi:signal transduction histidine kinase
MKILVVEDEQLVADDLRESLESLGYEVSGLAATGESAIAQAEQLCPHLVLMDIRLRGPMDGIVAATVIQERFQIPVIYLTANGDRNTLDRAKATRPFGYILKPFDDATLATTIEIALARHQAEVVAQQSLRASIKQQHAAESEIQRKSRVLSRVSHELRNPLTTMQFALVALQQSQDKLPEPKRQMYFQRIQDAIHSFSYLLENILTLEKSSVGRLPLNLSTFDVVQFCHDQIEMFQFSAGNRHTLKFTSACESCVAMLDATLIWHLLNNLLSNAVKYSPLGGPVDLSLDLEKTHLNLRVTDQGLGIPESDLQQLFEPFQRGSNVSDIPGTGLGLAIAHQYVQIHGGELLITSTVGQGTTFTAHLPWRQPTADSSQT